MTGIIEWSVDVQICSRRRITIQRPARKSPLILDQCHPKPKLSSLPVWTLIHPCAPISCTSFDFFRIRDNHLLSNKPQFSSPQSINTSFFTYQSLNHYHHVRLRDHRSPLLPARRTRDNLQDLHLACVDLRSCQPTQDLPQQHQSHDLLDDSIHCQHPHLPPRLFNPNAHRLPPSDAGHLVVGPRPRNRLGQSAPLLRSLLASPAVTSKITSRLNKVLPGIAFTDKNITDS